MRSLTAAGSDMAATAATTHATSHATAAATSAVAVTPQQPACAAIEAAKLLLKTIGVLLHTRSCMIVYIVHV